MRKFFSLLTTFFLSLAPAAAQEGADGQPRIFKSAKHGADVLAFSPDGKHLATGGMFTIKIWDVATGKELQSFDATKVYIKSLAYTSDGKHLISGSWDNETNNVKVWDTTTWRAVRTIDTGDASVHSVAVNPKGTLLATGGRQKVLRIWDFATGKLTHGIDAHPRDVQSIAFHKDGRMLATCGYDSEVKLWDAESGQAIRAFPNEGVEFHWDAVAFSPDGKHLAASGVVIRVFDLATGFEVWKARPDDVMTSCLAYSPNGKFIATSGSNKNVRLWDAQTGKILASWASHPQYPINSVAFSPNGAWIASGGEIRLWPAPK